MRTEPGYVGNWYNPDDIDSLDDQGWHFFLYEQLKVVLDTCDKFGGRALAEKIFHENAERIYGQN